MLDLQTCLRGNPKWLLLVNNKKHNLEAIKLKKIYMDALFPPLIKVNSPFRIKISLT